MPTTSPRGRWGRAGALAALVAISVALAAGASPAAADTTANTDDSNVSVPTASWTYTAITATQVTNFLKANNARLTDIEPHDAAKGTWTVTMVRNAGAYAVPAWWWYYGLTGAQVSSHLTNNQARLIHIQPYAVNGQTRFAAIMVRNTGAQAREWYWGYGTSASAISNHLSQRGTRLTDLESYYENGTKRHAFISVRNTGGDANQWFWYLNQTAAGVASRLSSTGARLIDLERLPNGTYDVVMVKGTGDDNASWWYRYGFTSIYAVLQHAAQLGVRVLDIETYLVGSSRRYDAIFIDNSNAPTRRIRGVFAQRYLDASGNPSRGIFEAFLKRVNGGTTVALNAYRRAETASSLKVLHLIHAARRVQAGESITSAFTYYDYPSSAPYPDGLASNACPRPVDETAANRRTNYNYRTGLREMMRISDNRTTRGVVLRYGGFSPFNTTASQLGLTGTTLRHNIGCAYFNPGTGKITTAIRNDTTARDLATVYESAWRGTSVSGTARGEFFALANPSSGVGSTEALRAIIDQEAAAQGKSAIASQFAAAVRRWGKGGSYNTCLPNSTGGCGQSVLIRSGAGLIRIPAKSNGSIVYRDFVFGRLVSDVPMGCSGCPTEAQYEETYSKASVELYREQIRSALLTW